MSIGFWQILLIVGIVIVLFGAGRLPKIMANLGLGMKAFKKNLEEDTPLLKEDKEKKK